MNVQLLKYYVSPRVVEANKKQIIQVKGLDTSCTLYDDTEYIVSILAIDGWEYIKNSDVTVKSRDILTEKIYRPVNGILYIEHLFTGEHEWKITITQVENENRKNCKMVNLSFAIYSLEEDLYKRRPYKGDLHIHTTGSDGNQSPEMVTAQYRKYGYDFISITDHHTIVPSLEVIEIYKDIATPMKLFPGEEVHPKKGGVFHIINFNPRSSVNAIAAENPEKVEREVEAIAETLDIEDEINRKEIAWFKWIYDAVHKAGGICIYPHPYWIRPDGAMNIHSFASEEMLRRELCDVFEIIGGCDVIQNKIQVQLNYEMQKNGHKFPIVASSDSHSALSRGASRFDQAWTIVFSESSDEIPENILKGMSIAVENFDVNNKNVYGELRLVKYTWFLIQNYFETHDAYCNAAGQAILRYVLGDKTQNTLISMLENELKKFDESFFLYKPIE